VYMQEDLTLISWIMLIIIIIS